MFFRCLDDQDAISTEAGSHLIQIDALRDFVHLFEVISARSGVASRQDGQLLAVEFDSNVFWVVGLHVQHQLVLVSLLQFQKD